MYRLIANPNTKAPAGRYVYRKYGKITQAPAGRHVSEILAVRITREKVDNALEDVLKQLGLNEERSKP